MAPTAPSRRAAIVLAAAFAAALALVAFWPTRAPQGTTFVGHHRYAFRLSPRTTGRTSITSAFRDEKKTSEVVFVHPKGISSKEVLATPESAYAQQGILRLEVNLNTNYPPESQDKLLEAFEFAARTTLDERKEPYKVAALEGSSLPGFAIHIGGAHAITQVFLKGGRLHYLLTSDGNDLALHEILSSLADPDQIPAAGAK